MIDTDGVWECYFGKITWLRTLIKMSDQGQEEDTKKKTYWDIDLPDLSGNKRDNEKK